MKSTGWVGEGKIVYDRQVGWSLQDFHVTRGREWGQILVRVKTVVCLVHKVSLFLGTPNLLSTCCCVRHWDQGRTIKRQERCCPAHKKLSRWLNFPYSHSSLASGIFVNSPKDLGAHRGSRKSLGLCMPALGTSFLTSHPGSSLSSYVILASCLTFPGLTSLICVVGILLVPLEFSSYKE